jgi:hypothetical protein
MIKLLSHITLSAILLLSATGMTINMHFCEGHLYDVALIAPAHDCCETDGTEDTCQHDQDQNRSHQCEDGCEDESIQAQSTTDFFVSGYSFDFENSHTFDLLFATQLLIEKPLTAESKVVGVLNYKKPPPQEVVLSQIQSFLI